MAIKMGWDGGGTSVLAEQRRGWSLIIFCARATRGRRLPSLDARSGRSIRPHPLERNEQAWKEHVNRWTRALEHPPTHPLNLKGMNE
jgi:hypothetical protein